MCCLLVVKKGSWNIPIIPFTCILLQMQRKIVQLIHLKLKCDGVWEREDREYTVSADKNFTTLPSDLYVLPEKCVFPAGQLQDTIEIVLLDGEVLKEKMCRLMLKVDETEFVKEGEVEFSRAIFLVSSKLIRPDWWTVWDGGTTNTFSEARTEPPFAFGIFLFKRL